MSFVKELIVDLIRALEKQDPEQRAIALRVLEDVANKRLETIEAQGRSNAIEVINGLILDVMDAPGMRSPYLGFSTQDILVAARGKIIEGRQGSPQRRPIEAPKAAKKTGHTGKGG